MALGCRRAALPSSPFRLAASPSSASPRSRGVSRRPWLPQPRLHRPPAGRDQPVVAPAARSPGLGLVAAASRCAELLPRHDPGVPHRRRPQAGRSGMVARAIAAESPARRRSEAHHLGLVCRRGEPAAPDRRDVAAARVSSGRCRAVASRPCCACLSARFSPSAGIAISTSRRRDHAPDQSVGPGPPASRDAFGGARPAVRAGLGPRRSRSAYRLRCRTRDHQPSSGPAHAPDRLGHGPEACAPSHGGPFGRRRQAAARSKGSAAALRREQARRNAAAPRVRSATGCSASSPALTWPSGPSLPPLAARVEEFHGMAVFAADPSAGPGQARPDPSVQLYPEAG